MNVVKKVIQTTKDFGEFIKERRKTMVPDEHGKFSRDRISDAVGMTNTTLTNIENANGGVRSDILFALARYLGVKIEMSYEQKEVNNETTK
jgi:transcriptional regulator with XRE-family HTH domain